MAKKKTYTVSSNVVNSNKNVNVNNDVEYDTDNQPLSTDCKIYKEYKEKECNVITRLLGNKVVVNFDNLGIIVSTNNLTKTIKIKYIGEIGTPDFKYEVV